MHKEFKLRLKSIKSYGSRTDKSMQTILRLERVRFKIHQQIINYLNNFNLSFNQFKVLEVLYHRGDLNVSTITKLTVSTPGNITVVVKNLKKAGWIESICDENDKRVSILSITKKGKEKIEEVFPAHSKNLRSHFDVLSDEELETLFNLLSKVYRAN